MQMDPSQELKKAKLKVSKLIKSIKSINQHYEYIKNQESILKIKIIKI